VFAHVLVSSLLVSVVNFTLWFAVTFWVYLETRSVLATGLIGGIFLVATASTGVWFGSLVDHHRKQQVMQWSAAASFALYAACLGLYLTTPAATFRDPASPLLWTFVVLLMLGVIAGGLRGIALPTMVTLLVPEAAAGPGERLVGTTSGVSFLITSVISGLLVAYDGMRSVLVLALGVLAASAVHLSRLQVPETTPGPHAQGRRGARGRPARHGPAGARGAGPGAADRVQLLQQLPRRHLHGAHGRLRAVPGVGAGMGAAVGVLSTGAIVGGLLVARIGLGSNPVRVILLVSVVSWTATALFPLRSSILLLSVAMMVFMLLMPFAEAAEQTVLQRVVPFERQGRVFGFAQSVEQAASPLTAFLIAPATQLWVIPSMTDGAGPARSATGSAPGPTAASRSSSSLPAWSGCSRPCSRWRAAPTGG
jgi:DHA3 family multidrug efflux protein-like MFS transporter